MYYRFIDLQDNSGPMTKRVIGSNTVSLVGGGGGNMYQFLLYMYQFHLGFEVTD